MTTELGEDDCGGTFIEPFMQWLDGARRQLSRLVVESGGRRASRRAATGSRPWPLVTDYGSGTPSGGYAQTFHDHLAARRRQRRALIRAVARPSRPRRAIPNRSPGGYTSADDQATDAPIPLPSRRTFLGAPPPPRWRPPVSHPGPHGGAVHADIPPARAAGMPAPDVETLLGQMTLDEKIGQMTQIDKNALHTGREVHDLMVGSVLSGADSLPRPNAADTWVDMYDGYQSQALSTRLGIPMIYGVDAVHGHGGLKGSTIFPHHIGLGCTRSPETVQAAARVTAREVAGTGIDWTFAPCIAVARDERWGRTYEGYGETPELAESLGAAAVRGFQDGVDDGSPAPVDTSRIMACAKHFLGDGGTFGGKDQGDTKISEEELRRLHLPGYIAAIKAGTATVMVSYSSWNGRADARQSPPDHRRAQGRARLHRLRGQRLGGDRQDVARLQPGHRALDQRRHRHDDGADAGGSLPRVPAEAEGAGRERARAAGAHRRRRPPHPEAEEALRDLWSGRSPTARSPRRSARRRTARSRATRSRKSLVVLKNDGGVLPLTKSGRIHLAGFRADDMGVQCGGWSTGWRGHRGAITPGTTIRQGLTEAVGAGRLDFSKDGAGAERADVVVVVVGEDPYAEGGGDRADLALNKEDRALIETVKRTGKPMVVVLISGRPLILGDIVDSAKAIVAAWLPGTEGAGVADVLTGAVKPTGKLSCSWPRAMADVPINVGDAKYDPLFPYDHGLSW